MNTKEKNRTGRRINGFALLFPAVLLYYEILFRLFTVGGVFHGDMLITLCFCFAYGGIGYLLCTISRNRRHNRHIAVALLLLTAVPYLVEVFIYQSFKIFYDLQTIVNGAGDVLTGFTGDMFRLVFSGGGILRVALFLLPGVLYGVFSGAMGEGAPISGRDRAMTAARMAAFYLICLLAIHISPALSRTYGEAYNYHAAVSRFGFLTGLRLDVKNNLFGQATFSPVDSVSAPRSETAGEEETADVPDTEDIAEQSLSGAEGTPEPTAEPVDYGVNQLDLPLDDPSASGQISGLNAYVAGLTASSKNAYTGLFKGKNLIFITAEAFSKEVIDPELTPALYRLASKGVHFNDYYQPSGTGTTGGEYQNIFGLLPTDGGSSFTNMAGNFIKLNIGTKLNELGYYGKAFHNNSYTYYSRDKTHVTLGYSDGYMGYGNGMEQFVKKQWPESDYEMFAGTVPDYIDRQPFDVYYMTVSGHGLYDLAGNAMSSKHIDRVKDLTCSDMVKQYIAANLDLEDAVAYLLEQLEAKGIADDTVICLTADHFPYGIDDSAPLGEMEYLSELYGYEVETAFQRDHNAWLLWCGSLEDQEPIVVDEPTFSLDILPTLLNLFGVEFDSRLLPGRDVFSDAPALVFNGGFDWKSEYGTYYSVQDKFEPSVDEAELPANYVENVSAIVRNKVNFCRGVLDADYYTYLFWR